MGVSIGRLAEVGGFVMLYWSAGWAGASCHGGRCDMGICKVPRALVFLQWRWARERGERSADWSHGNGRFVK